MEILLRIFYGSKLFYLFQFILVIILGRGLIFCGIDILQGEAGEQSWGKTVRVGALSVLGRGPKVGGAWLTCRRQAPREKC